MDKPWKVIFAFVAVFIAGAIFGGVFTLRTSAERRPFGWGDRSMADRPSMKGPFPESAQGQRPGPMAGQFQGQVGPAMLRQLNQRLKLTDDQREKVRPLVVRAAEDMQRLSRENLQNTTRIMERMHSDISILLTPEQRTELENLKTQMRERVRRGMEGRGEPRNDGQSPRRNPQGPNQFRPNQQPGQPAPEEAPASPAPANP